MPTQNDIPVAQRLTDTKRSPQKQSVSANSSTNTSTNVVVRSLQSVPWWAYGLAVLAFLSPLVSTRIWFALNANSQNANSQNASTAATESSATTRNEPVKYIFAKCIFLSDTKRCAIHKFQSECDQQK